MEYRAEKNRGRIWIIDKDCAKGEFRVTQNLENNELKIRQLNAKDCPVSALCITLENEGITSFCKHMGDYPPQLDIVQSPYKKIRCKHDPTKKVLHDALLLRVDSCPLGENKDCIGCKNFFSVVAENGDVINKSHAHVICKEMRKGG